MTVNVLHVDKSDYRLHVSLSDGTHYRSRFTFPTSLRAYRAALALANEGTISATSLSTGFEPWSILSHFDILP
jgi:hypothetical protein